jgi:hypothetical protein
MIRFSHSTLATLSRDYPRLSCVVTWVGFQACARGPMCRAEALPHMSGSENTMSGSENTREHWH